MFVVYSNDTRKVFDDFKNKEKSLNAFCVNPL